jgi:exoribonuclease II
MVFRKNDIIDYFDDRRICTGMIVEADDRRVRVLSYQGKETKLPNGRVLISGTDHKFPVSGTRDEQLTRLRDLSRQRDEIKLDINLRELWEVVGPETREIDIHDLSELLFGEDQDINHPASLLRAIFEDRVFFKIKPDRIEVPSPERVEQALTQREREEERKALTVKAADIIVRLKNGEAVQASDMPTGFREMLEEAAAFGRDWVTHKTVKEVFSRAGAFPPLTPLKVLVRLGVWSEDENLRLHAEKVPVDFTPEAENEAAQVAQKSLPSGVEDLTAEEAVAIDSVSTRDVDDALSLSVNGSELTLGIHITDVAHFVEHDSALDLEIRQRATSIYLPDMTVPMIPRVLSEHAASLTVGATQPAVSLLVKIEPDLSAGDFRVCSSLIKVRERISYEEADAKTADPESKEAKLLAIACKLREGRIARGAVIFKDPELSVSVARDGEIQLSRRDRETPAQILVSEMMILANSLFARFFKDRFVPAIFRSQPEPSEKIRLGEEYDPVESYMCKRSLVRGDVGPKPLPHSTLGLDCYTTATSPLRRYPDIIVQRQLKSMLETGKPLLDGSQLVNIMTLTSFPLERAVQMERERQRYFLLKYLLSRMNDEFDAVVLYRFPKFFLVQIMEFCVNAVLTPPDGVSLGPYDRIRIKPAKVNPREDKLSVSLVELQ